jgi:hypothetical protein
LRARVITVLSAIAILIIALAVTITRGPEFHHYADTRTWLGIPNAGDVLSNAMFLVVALWSTHPARLGVAAIALGSGVYHAVPSDTTLAFDWLPIVLTLAIVNAVVIGDRAGARAGRHASILGPAFAIAAVAWWVASGGTHGGNMAPYVAVQAVGIALPAVLVATTPGSIRLRFLLVGLIAFAIARLCASYDRALLDAIGVSGHSLKHVVAALAAGCALRALDDRNPPRSP